MVTFTVTHVINYYIRCILIASIVLVLCVVYFKNNVNNKPLFFFLLENITMYDVSSILQRDAVERACVTYSQCLCWSFRFEHAIFTLWLAIEFEMLCKSTAHETGEDRTSIQSENSCFLSFSLSLSYFGFNQLELTAASNDSMYVFSIHTNI